MSTNTIQIIPEEITNILAETIHDYETRTGKILQPAHIERSILQTIAYREVLARKGINEAFRQTFPQLATGVALDLCGEPMNCYRLKDQPARCVLRFSVTEQHTSIAIPKGTRVGVDESLWFITQTDELLLSTVEYVDIDAVANVTGVTGNGWEVGRVNQLQTNLNTQANVTVINIDETRDGVNVETDEDYRKRILLAPEAFSTCGSVSSYEYHTRSVSQLIADVAINNLEGGVVKVTVLTKYGVPSTALINQIQQYLSGEKLRPLCDTVLVEPAEKIPYQIIARFDLLASHNESQVMLEAERALRNHLSQHYHQLGRDIVPIDIIKALKVEGVYNIQLIEPQLTTIYPTQWAECEAIHLSANEIRQDG